MLTPTQFVFFLQGFSEIGNKPPTPAQWAIIKTKLNSVFEKVTPDRNNVLINQSIERTLDLLDEYPICGAAPAGESPLVRSTYCTPIISAGHIIGPSSCHPVLPFKIEADPPALKSVDRTC